MWLLRKLEYDSTTQRVLLDNAVSFTEVWPDWTEYNIKINEQWHNVEPTHLFGSRYSFQCQKLCFKAQGLSHYTPVTFLLLHFPRKETDIKILI
jgi:hypothetical protein